MEAFRSFSTSSTTNSSTASISRVASSATPLNINFNKQSSPKEHLYYQCELLKIKLRKIPGMEPYLNEAYRQAEEFAEQQALALSQETPSSYNMGANGNGGSVESDSSRVSIHSSNTASSAAKGSGNSSNHVFTFTAGVLPASVSVDPATHLWKLFQMGAPLCLLFNHLITIEQPVPVVASDDLRICKKSVYDFLIAVKTNVNFNDDFMFTISNVFSDNTEDLIKIVKVINKLLDDYGSSVDATTPEEDERLVNIEVVPSDERSKVFKEIIDTERKYVQDLELLIQYRKELQDAEQLSSEQINTLFPNLSEIIDFQRRFLNGLECNINVPIKYQRIGSVFIHASIGPFKAYELWSTGQLTAIDLIQREASNLRKSSSLLDPGFELQAYILKPIQRLCKYPLLLKELIKHSTPEEQTAFNELLVARNAIKDVANQVNEAQRRAENKQYLDKLRTRVQNWRGFDLDNQGELLYFCKVGVRDAENEREYVAYLFEKIIFFFIEVVDKEKEKRSKFTRKKSTGTNSMSNSTVNLLDTLNSRDTPLELKGRVYISEVYNITTSPNQGYMLIISWSGKKESGSFTLRYPTEESRNQWEQCLRNLKTSEMHEVMNSSRQRDSQASEDSIYDYTVSPYENNRASNGSNLNTPGRHYSSSSTYSMMRSMGRKSVERHSSSSSGTSYFNNNNNAAHSVAASFDIHVKLIYNGNEIDGLSVNSSIGFNELYSTILNKLIATGETEEILVKKLKYRDEDGDFVIMDSNDDWAVAVEEMEAETAGNSGYLTIWVS
ncbi:CDC24 [[Candida] subhashii]|uniref:CDC24 n=1 Tax=[Candida] subhashii TaxID=561895 RepID=A0A8J5QG70_9ASCO|nr:CDC24 [[Candida] subhashii]KAG7661494.1 CDC24 [[Candida] subhashii]